VFQVTSVQESFQATRHYSMVKSSIEVGHGPAVSVTSEMVGSPASSRRILSGAPAFPRMKRVSGRKRLMREASDSDSESEDSVQGRPDHIIKKFSRRSSAPRSGDHSSKVQEEFKSPDVEYVKTERVVLVQTFLTAWCVRRD
jgi:hypothetical protein